MVDVTVDKSFTYIIHIVMYASHNEFGENNFAGNDVVVKNTKVSGIPLKCLANCTYIPRNDYVFFFFFKEKHIYSLKVE